MQSYNGGDNLHGMCVFRTRLWAALLYLEIQLKSLSNKVQDIGEHEQKMELTTSMETSLSCAAFIQRTVSTLD